MEECDSRRKGLDMTIKLLGGVISLGTVLVLGGYGYTWSEMKFEQEEKRQWREKHQQVLDKKFEEVKQGQEKLTELINRKEETNNNLLEKILDEQRKANEYRMMRDRIKASEGTKFTR
jgi:hypothetical protein